MSKVAVVIPFFQREQGVLLRAVQSVFAQSFVDFHIFVVNDGSPICPKAELRSYLDRNEPRLTIIDQNNAGPGAARNRGLDILPAGTEYVAFLDSDDEWLAGHLDNAVAALDEGYDFYFSDFYFSDFKEKSAFTRAGRIPLTEHKKLPSHDNLYEYTGDMADQILVRGNVIGTSNVVYRYRTHSRLRFRTEFFNGQDYLFWLDFFAAGGRAIFSSAIECNCGVGVNIFAGAGWNTDRSLDRLRNELKLWTSVDSIFKLASTRKAANVRRIRRIRCSIVRDILHRIAHRKTVHLRILADIICIDPVILLVIPTLTGRIMIEQLSGRFRPRSQ
ncbi:MAG TPA: glycosyltransferase [Noviherbaspirillum sp.]|jgi:succinoglycan biosynthesis protein ExoW|uniref:glycosyltransferase family 2 protein n=1 Tax=Noviherbaspirillum sp. TaxID=1926288 RepID=UPI002DDCAFF0|nr:glycosyltransferase [Noviherbaspirillum sp.]HEV2608909.1 glycosyltransferase [Noviherbaspirillum sp.]